jgi:NAD(P)-dependent dehydrogenase (short-subunit alcohol dehydrogenase family)
MTAVGQTPDRAGLNHFTADMPPPTFKVPWDGRGSPRDMGALALFLVSNWFVNGETVLIDGGVRSSSSGLSPYTDFLMTRPCFFTLLRTKRVR